MKKLNHYFILIMLMIWFSTVSINCGVVESVLAVLSGTVQSGNGNLAINEATVSNSPGTLNQKYSTDEVAITNANGYYEFRNVSPGTKTLYIKKGLFADTISVYVPENQASVVANTALIEPEAGVKFAYFRDNRDSVQGIIRSLGYSSYLTEIHINDFENLNTLMQYSVIFINGGSSSKYLNSQIITSNISSYLNSGGKIYASDWAIICLAQLYDIGGSFNGDPQIIPSAIIVEQSLKKFLHDSSSTSIQYIMDDWVSINGPTDSCNCIVPYIKGTYTVDSNTVITNRTLSFYKIVGNLGGKFIYTTFRNEPNISQQVKRIIQFYFYEF